MALSRRLLGVDEHVVVHTRTHAKALVWPAVLFILVAAAVGAGEALIPGDLSPVGQVAVFALGLVLVIWWSVVPFLRWRSTTYTITDRRLLTRSGILTRNGKDLPLARVNDVSYQRSLSDRMLGCGSLVIQTAAEAGTIVLHDIPDVETVHQQVAELLFDRHDDDGHPAYSDHRQAHPSYPEPSRHHGYGVTPGA